MKNFKIIKSETIYNGRVFDVRIDKIKYDSGNESIREIAVHNGGAVVLAINDNDEILFVKQYRHPFDDYLIELPAGKLEPNEEPLKCAVRELEEETGMIAGKITKLGAIATTPGFCTELLHIYLAEELQEGKTNREEGEYGMSVIKMSLQEAEKKITNGEIFDAKTLAGILYYKLFEANARKINRI